MHLSLSLSICSAWRMQLVPHSLGVCNGSSVHLEYAAGPPFTWSMQQVLRGCCEINEQKQGACYKYTQQMGRGNFLNLIKDYMKATTEKP